MTTNYITDPALLAELNKNEVVSPEVKVTPKVMFLILNFLNN